MLEVDARAMSRYVTVVAVVTLLASVRLAVADAPIVAVGVISPEQGRSGSTGLAHRASIEWAFEDIHHYVLAGNQHVTLPPIYADDHGDPEESVRVARRLVNEEHVVA